MFCTECGTKLPDSAKFCFQCGARIGFDNSIAVVDSKQETRLVPMKCTNCGGYVEFKNNLETAQCPFCNSTFIVERAIRSFTSANGGRDFNMLLGLIESSIHSHDYLEAFDYLGQAYILAPLTEKLMIVEKINKLLDDAFDNAPIAFKIYLLKYKVLHGLAEVDTNFIRRIRSYEHSLKNAYLYSELVKIEGHGFDDSDLTFLNLSYNAVVIYQRIGRRRLFFKRNEVQNMEFNRKTDVFSLRYRDKDYYFETHDPNQTARFVDSFKNCNSIYTKLISEPVGSYAPLFKYFKRVVEQSYNELDNLIASDARCSLTPFASFVVRDKRIICYDDEIQIWEQSKYLRPWEEDDVSDFDYYRIDEIDELEIEESSLLFSEFYDLSIVANNSKDYIVSVNKSDQHASDELIKMADRYRSLGVNVSML